MSAIAQQESLVKESLFQFITKNVPSADLSVIDEIVLSYVISILEEASQDPCFDVEGFIEMMAAYVPEFARIDPGQVCSWVLELEAECSRREDTDSISNHDDSASSDKISLTLQSLSDMLPPVTKASRLVLITH
ncbi:CUE domain-containing protein 2 [Manduca sexta]|uniref:CUE domain-containing protein 2 n=1 Tax=Manduca sexta TaxID=7130 RepID=UPI00188EF884|nr:CUE domain-containing protein 2 [Manduca sexta]